MQVNTKISLNSIQIIKKYDIIKSGEKQMTKNEVIVNGISINYKKINNEDYICLTDIARFYNNEAPSDIVKSWMSNKDSFEFYSLW